MFWVNQKQEHLNSLLDVKVCISLDMSLTERNGQTFVIN